MEFALHSVNLHPTTESCLEMLQWLSERRAFERILDMGCGHGVLGLAAAGIWDAPLVAADIAEKAVQDTKAQAQSFGLERQATVLRSDGFSHPDIAKHAPYDLIIINMLGHQLVAMARDAVALLSPGGCILLSGMLAWERPDAQAAYTGLGTDILHESVKNPWHTLLLSKPAAPGFS